MAMKPTKEESKHFERVLSFGCIACVKLNHSETPAEIHHIGNGAMGKRASNYQVIPLCPHHHRLGGHGEAVHAGRKAWEANFGTEKELLSQTMGWLDL